MNARKLTTISTALIFGWLAASAQADPIIDAGPGSNLQNFQSGNYVAGSEFTLADPLLISALGWLDAEGDGLAGSHEVFLWNSANQMLLSQATVMPDSISVVTAQGTGMWFYAAVTPVELPAGTYRVVGTCETDCYALSNDKIGNGAALSQGYVRTLFPNGGAGYPDLTLSREAVRATAFADALPPQSVPEPATLGLLGLGLLGFGFTGRRKKA